MKTRLADDKAHATALPKTTAKYVNKFVEKAKANHEKILKEKAEK